MIGALHASIAVTTKELPVGFVATHDTVGATVSTTVTVCVALVWLPDASVAVHVTTVVPTRNFGGALFVNATVPAQSSVAVGTPSAGDPQSSRCRSGGTDVMIGFVVSTTVTVCVVIAIRPMLSSPRHVTVDGPTGSCAGASLVTVTGP